MPSAAEARAFLAASTFDWHQRFELVPGVMTPGPAGVPFLLDRSRIPDDLTGVTVLDVGTTNGGTAFALEARGAARVVAVDVVDAEFHGILRIREFLGSKIEFVQSSIYELSTALQEKFDLVVCWGVLYHLRHPLLALDELRSVTAGSLSIETAVADAELPRDVRSRSLVSFYRHDELAGDPTNWFAPTTRALTEWIASAGFRIERVDRWPEPDPTRAMVSASVADGDPEYQQHSYELPLTAHVAVELPWKS